MIDFYNIRRKYRFYLCLSDLGFVLIFGAFEVWSEVNKLYFWFGLDCRWDIMMLFLWYLYQALWLDLRGVCVDRVRLCFKHESERRVCCSLSESVLLIWIFGFWYRGFLRLFLLIFIDFYWSGSGMDRGVCRRVVPNDFWWFFGVRDLVVRFLVIWVLIWIFRRVSRVELL